MENEDYTYTFIQDQIDEAIRFELEYEHLQKRDSISRAEIKNIVTRVLARCGVESDRKTGNIASKGLIDVYHRGLYIAARESDSEAIKLYPLRPGQRVEVLMDEGWQACEVEANPAAESDRTALRVRLSVPDDVPVIGAFARINRAITASQKTGALEAVKQIRREE